MQNSKLKELIKREQRQDVKAYLNTISLAEKNRLISRFYEDENFCILGTEAEFEKYVHHMILGGYYL